LLHWNTLFFESPKGRYIQAELESEDKFLTDQSPVGFKTLSGIDKN